ncbi:MAG: serine protease [Kiloniellales bacterium]|nr:serine protease [Kiloniellales bacterium]
MARRLVLLVTCLGVVALFLRFAEQSGPRRPAPAGPPPAVAEAERRPERPSAEPLPGPSRRDPVLKLSDSDPCAESCSGTAFAIDGQGHWLTARHVVRGCGKVALQTGPREAVRVRKIVSHPRADVALLETGMNAPALPLTAGPLYKGQDGFHLGYPRGEPGDVYGELMGRVKVRSRRSVEPGLLWAEIDRAPRNDLPLGGLSGGPVVTAEGAVVGVAIAASPRRGRVTSAAPRSLSEVMDRAEVTASEVTPVVPGEVKVAPSNYAGYGDHLREKLSVAKVLCWSERTERRRRPPLR